MYQCFPTIEIKAVGTYTSNPQMCYRYVLNYSLNTFHIVVSWCLRERQTEKLSQNKLAGCLLPYLLRFLSIWASSMTIHILDYISQKQAIHHSALEFDIRGSMVPSFLDNLNLELTRYRRTFPGVEWFSQCGSCHLRGHKRWVSCIA